MYFREPIFLRLWLIRVGNLQKRRCAVKFVKYFLTMWVLSFGYGAAFAQTDFWQSTNGPDGGTVNIIAVNKSNGYIFAVVAGVGMMRSTDNGASWVLKNSGLPGASVQAIAINANGVIFAGTNGQGVFRSTDHGESWTPANNGIASTHRNIRALAIDSITKNLFAGASSSGLYRSRDNGNTWTPLPTGLTGAVTIHALVIKHGSSVVFAGTDKNGILRSTNNGDAWTRIDTSSIYKNVRALVVAASGAVFAGADSASTKRAILRSADNGESWTRVFEPSSNVVWFALNSSNQIWAGTAGSGVYVSSDNGGHWSLRNNGLRGYAINTIAFNASDHIFAGAHCAGVFRSIDNGASWQAMNNGLAYTNILSLGINQMTGVIVAGTHCGGVFRSSDYGDNWEWAGIAGAQVTALTVNASGRFFAGVARLYLTETGGDIYYADDGITWKKVTPDNDAYFSFAINSAGHIYAGTGFYQLCGIINICDYGDIYRSTNNGASWSRVASKLDDFVYALAVNPSGRVYAGTGEGVYRSRGEFWDKLNSFNTRSLLIDPLNPNIILDGTSGGIWRSTDAGDSWALVRLMPNNFTWALAAQPAGEIYAGTQRDGVLKSADAGLTWTPANTGLTNMNVRSLAIHHASGKIFAGTNGSGVFRGRLSPPPPAAPKLASPANGAINQSIEITLAWQSSQGAAAYRLQVATDSLFATAVFDDSTITGTSRRIGPLAKGTTYYWRLNARNIAGPSAWSSTWRFTTESDAAPISPRVASSQSTGAEFWVDIGISNVQNLFGVSFELRYTNTAHIDALQVEAGPFLGNDLIFFPSIDDATGKVSIGISRKAGQGGVTGGGVIARVKFKSLATTPSGTQVTFSLSNVAANDHNGAPISSTPASATTTIQGLIVWPGDTNNDGKVDAADVLPIGLHWNKSGPARENRSTNWMGQPATPWSPEGATYADANGDGVVNQSDVLPIGLNWAKTHTAPPLVAAKNNATNLNESNMATLKTAISGDTNPGQEFWVDVKVGQAVNLFGLALELLYSPTNLVDPLNVDTVGVSSFMGNDVVFFSDIDKTNGKISIGITRKAGQGGVNDSGAVARVKMRVSNLAQVGQIVTLNLQNVFANDPAGQPIPVSVKGRTLVLDVESKQNEQGPLNFALYANVPNPFNPSTIIKYDLSKQAEVTLVIYDMLGRRVRTLVDQCQQTGRYAVIWDGRNDQGQMVSSGTFLYQLRAGTFVQTRRMALLR
jgi:ligand-binding sensor domain-containing protein